MSVLQRKRPEAYRIAIEKVGEGIVDYHYEDDKCWRTDNLEEARQKLIEVKARLFSNKELKVHIMNKEFRKVW